MDTAYFYALQRGDKAAARRVLHKAAKKLSLRFVFHGTNRAFYHFEPPSKVGCRHRDDEVGDVFWFTASYRFAWSYAKSPWTPNEQPDLGCSVVSKALSEQAASFSAPFAQAEQAPKTPRVIESFLRLTNPLIENYDGAPADYLPDDILKARASGNDGLIALEVDDGGTHDHYAVFNTSQILDASTIVRDLTGKVLSVSERLLSDAIPIISPWHH